MHPRFSEPLCARDLARLAQCNLNADQLNHKLYGAMAGIKVGTRAECDVVEAGLFLIKPAGDSVTIVNNEHFQPNIW